MLMLMVVSVLISTVEVMTLVYILFNEHIMEVIVVIMIRRIEIVSKNRHVSCRLHTVYLAWGLASNLTNLVCLFCYS